MKACLQIALAIIIGLFTVIGIIVVFVFILLPKGITPAKPTPAIITVIPVTTIALTVEAVATATAVLATSTPSPEPAAALPPILEPTATAIPVVAATTTPIPTPTSTAVSLATVAERVQAQPKIYLPAIEVVPTPNVEEAYRQSLQAWLLDAMKLADDLSVTVGSISPNTPEWVAAFDSLEQRIIRLASTLDSMQPPDGFVNAHEMMLISMEACTDAITHFRNGNFGFAELSIATCTAGFTMAPWKVP